MTAKAMDVSLTAKATDGEGGGGNDQDAWGL